MSTTSSHWLHVSGAANNTFYSMTANLTYGVGIGFGNVSGASFSCTTDAMGNGNSLHTYEGLSGLVWVADGVGTGRAYANTNPASVPMFFTKVNGSDAVDFETYGEG